MGDLHRRQGEVAIVRDGNDACGQDISSEAISNEAVAHWRTVALAAAFDVARYGVFGRPETEHFDAIPLRRALDQVSPQAATALKDKGDQQAQKAVGLIGLWRDVINYRAQAEAVRAAGGYDERSVEAASILADRAKSEALSLFAQKIINPKPSKPKR